MHELILFYILPLLSTLSWISGGPLLAAPLAAAPAPLAPQEAPAPVRELPAPAPAQSAPPSPQLPSAEEFAKQVEELVLQKTNAERAANKLPALKEDNELSAIARYHSADMLQKEYFEHEDPQGCSSTCRAAQAGYAYRALGENIFLMSGLNLSPQDAAATIVQGWMGSPGHRANILQKAYTKSGLGVVAAGQKIYATAMYSQPR